MLAYQVSKSIEINKSQSEIIDYLKDFKNWPEWSPWIILEPSCELTYSDNQGHVGAGYQWNGQRIGTGAVVLESTQEHRLDMELHFFSPYQKPRKGDVHRDAVTRWLYRRMANAVSCSLVSVFSENDVQIHD